MADHNEVLDIQRVIKEKVELTYHSTKGDDGTNLYKVDSVAGMTLAENDVILIGINKNEPTLKVSGSNAVALTHIDWSRYYGAITAFKCMKKKGLFGKETLKTLGNFEKKFYNADNLENEKISIKEMF